MRRQGSFGEQIQRGSEAGLAATDVFVRTFNTMVKYVAADHLELSFRVVAE